MNMPEGITGGHTGHPGGHHPGHGGPVKIVSWNTTNACNMYCAHCYREAGCKAEEELSTAEAKKLLTVLQTMAALSGSKDMQAIGDLSKQYEGVRVGFDMRK